MTDTTVGDGQVSTSAVLNDGDRQIVQSESFNAATGGQAYDTTINSGGQQFLMYGSATGATVNSGGNQYVYGTGMATGTILNGGFQEVDGSYDRYGAEQSNPHYTYGMAIGTVINDGGQQEVRSFAHDTVINSGGYQSVLLSGDALSAPNAVDNTTINSGGVMYISGGTPINTHLMDGGSIWVPEQDYSSPAYLMFDPQRDILTVHDGQSITEVHLAGDYSSTAFSYVEVYDGPASIRITAQSLCFCAGVRLATPTGEIAVERLRMGDQVVTICGDARPIRWLGSSTVLLSPENPLVIVRAGALAAGVPHRDVRVTRGHSFLLGDVLIPIGALVNGRSIVWDEQTRFARVFHIGLETHDVVVAEGAPAESYRDDGNASGYVMSEGTCGAPKAMPTCAPVVARGPIVERTWRRLTELADAAIPKVRAVA